MALHLALCLARFPLARSELAFRPIGPNHEVSLQFYDHSLRLMGSSHTGSEMHHIAYAALVAFVLTMISAATPDPAGAGVYSRGYARSYVSGAHRSYHGGYRGYAGRPYARGYARGYVGGSYGGYNGGYRGYYGRPYARGYARGYVGGSYRSYYGGYGYRPYYGGYARSYYSSYGGYSRPYYDDYSYGGYPYDDYYSSGYSRPYQSGYYRPYNQGYGYRSYYGGYRPYARGYVSGYARGYAGRRW
jgi:hypothetical protein